MNKYILHLALILCLSYSYGCINKKKGESDFKKAAAISYFYYCSKGDNCKPPPPCSKDCPYLVMNGDNFYGDYNFSINGNANSLISYPSTVTTVDVDYLLSDSKNYLYRRSKFSYNEAVNQKKKISNEMSRLKDLALYADNQDTASLAQSKYNSLLPYSSEVDYDFYLVYSNSNNTFLIYDDKNKVEIYAESVYQLQYPTDPKPSIDKSPIYIKLDNLSSPLIGSNIVLSNSITDKFIEVDYSGKRYSTKYNSSSINLIIQNIPSSAQTSTISIDGYLFSSNDNLVSIKITGIIRAYRN